MICSFLTTRFQPLKANTVYSVHAGKLRLAKKLRALGVQIISSKDHLKRPIRTGVIKQFVNLIS